jgi:hypothetical protein
VNADLMLEFMNLNRHHIGIEFGVFTAVRYADEDGSLSRLPTSKLALHLHYPLKQTSDSGGCLKPVLRAPPRSTASAVSYRPPVQMHRPYRLADTGHADPGTA